jgi:hypothetical protein
MASPPASGRAAPAAGGAAQSKGSVVRAPQRPRRRLLLVGDHDRLGPADAETDHPSAQPHPRRPRGDGDRRRAGRVLAAGAAAGVHLDAVGIPGDRHRVLRAREGDGRGSGEGGCRDGEDETGPHGALLG